MPIKLHAVGHRTRTLLVATGDAEQLGAEVAILNEVAARAVVVTMDRFAQQPIRFFLHKRG